MSGILNALVGANGGSSAAVDPYFNQTTLLLHGDGTNGAQNNTFLDSSTNNFTITRNGNTTQGTFTPFSQPDGRWSNYFNGSTDVIYATETSSQFTFGTGDYTYECWIYPTSGASTQRTIFGRTNTGNVAVPYIYLVTTTGVISVYYNSTIVSGVTAIPSNAWTHIMVSRLSGTTRIFVNGNQEGSASDTTNLTSPTAVMIGGNGTSPTNPFNGYISNARILKGTGYSSITVPTSPLTAITNTSLLTCQSNRFVDNSTNAFAITASGTPSVQVFSPFAPTAAYSTTTNGGSAYFDGSGDYLNTTMTGQTFGTGDFTVEFWVNPSSVALSDILDTRTSGDASNCWCAQFDGTNFYWAGDGTSVLNVPVSYFPLGVWTHVAFTRSSNTLKVYVNGTQYGSSVTKSNNYTSTNLNVGVAAGGYYYKGYVSGIRLVAGSVIYSGNFTPPTAPPTAITNTSLLLSATNAGILDNAKSNDLETVGNAQISTTQSKFGVSSMYFDGTGSYASFVNNPINLLGNFTVEGWFYSATATTAFQGVVSFGGISSSIAPVALLLGSATSGANAGSSVALLCSVDGSSWAINAVSSTGVTSNNTWYHFAVVRNGGTITVYINGTAVITSTAIASTTTLYSSGTINRVGGYAYSSYYYAGYLDDIRVTKGVARYTANFTVPSAAFPNQ